MADTPALLAKCSEGNSGGAYDCKVTLMASVSADSFGKDGENESVS